MYNILLFFQYLSSILIVVSIFYIMRQKPSPIQRDMLLLQIANLVTIMSYTLEMQATDLSGALVATKFSYLGTPITSFAMFFLILDFARIPINYRFRVACGAVQCMFIFTVFSNDWHNLFYKSVEFVNEGMFPHLVKDRGPLYALFNGVNILFCVGMIVICFIYMTKVKSRDDKIMLCMFGLIIFLPSIGYILYITNLTDGYNLSILGYAVGSSLFLILFKKYDVFGTVNIAWENVIQFIGAGLLVYDKSGRIIYQNEKAKEIDIAENASEYYRTKEYVFRDNNAYKVEKLQIENEGSEVGFAYFIDNETDNYNYEQKLKEEKKRADEESNAKTVFLSTMSHDIRTPMNAILGLTSIANMNIDDNEKVKECLEKIENSGNHLIELINEVLDINKIESGKFELIESDFDLGVLINQIETMCKPLVEEREQSLTVDVSGVETTWIRGDKSRLSQILMNLVSNSIKYTDNGGLITVKITETSKGEKTSVFKLVVRDNGIGMSEEFIKTLFDPFTRADQEKVYKSQGTGLGMTITKQFVELMGGTIDVKSNIGIGTTFTIILPVNHGDDATKKKNEETMEKILNADFSGKRALIVEDNDTNAEILREFLIMAGVESDIARNGIEAIDCISREEENYYDIVFMDGEMPKMNGYEAAAKIRFMDTKKYAKKIPIVAVTGNAFSEDIARAKNAGMNGHIAKPVEREKLYEAIATYCV